MVDELETFFGVTSYRAPMEPKRRQLGYTIELTADEFAWLEGNLREMKEMYADDSRSDWFDADEDAISVAMFMANKIGIE
jgi:hypothetical protein